MIEPRQRLQAIRDALLHELAAEHVEIIDDSRHHVGHLGAEPGAGHYQVLVVSPRFEGASRVTAQRMVYDALGSLMEQDIHALQIRALTPEQWRSL